jgi:hypothetical protein
MRQVLSTATVRSRAPERITRYVPPAARFVDPARVAAQRSSVTLPLSRRGAHGRLSAVSSWKAVAVAERPEVPEPWVRRLRALLVDRFPECVQENAWVGVRWRVGEATIAHVFGGEDGLFRITFRAESDEVMAFRHLGRPYFKAG